MKPKWLIRRRHLLTGACGVAIGLPFLDAMVAPGRAIAGPQPPKRFAVYFKPGGSVLDAWTPSGTETSFAMNVSNKALEPFKKQLLVLEGIDLEITQIGSGHPHSRGMGGVLTGRELPFGPYETCGGTAGFPDGPSIDQVIAEKIGTGAKFKSLEVAVNWPTDRRDGGKAAPTNCICYAGPDQAVPMATDPLAVWDKLFSAVGSDPEALSILRAKQKSILDAVTDSYATLIARVGQDDRQRLDQHLTRIREVEQSLNVDVVLTASCQKPAAPEPLGDPDTGLIGEPGSSQQKNPVLDARMPELGKAMMDLLVMAFACDLTRVGTMQWVDSQAYNTFPFLDLNDGHHGYQHDNGYQPDALTKINTWYMEQFAYFLQALADLKEEDGQSLLDTTYVLLASELQQADSHSQDNMPFILAGGSPDGALKTGRYLKYGGVPHNDLLVSILNAYGIPDTTFGNPDFCSGPLPNLT